MTGPPLRVLIADDHPLFRQGLRAILDGADGIQVVGEAATGTQVIAATIQLEPDVVLMDLHMPELSGIEATRQLTQQCPDVRVLVLTMIEQDASVLTALRAGARGYLVKGADRDEVLRAVRVVATGEAILGTAVADHLAAMLEPNSRCQQAFPQLTERERQVLELIARGSSNTEIATALGLSLKTIRNHISNIFAKLQVAGRAQAIIKARDAGLT
jgi:DNA-binding NarL/FixJ family response regulator